MQQRPSSNRPDAGGRHEIIPGKGNNSMENSASTPSGSPVHAPSRIPLSLSRGNTPRWLIFLFDTGLCLASVMLAYLVRFNFHIPENETSRFSVVFPLIIGTRILLFLLFRTYAGIIRYTSTRDAIRIFLSVTTGSLLFSVYNGVSYAFYDIFIIPFSILIIDYLFTVFAMISLRILVKTLYMEITNPSRYKRDVIIYGAGESGVITKRTLDRDAGSKYRVIAFLDDDPRKWGKRLEGVGIYNPEKDLADLLRANSVAHVIISIQQLPAARRQAIAERCLATDTKVLNVPPVTSWINGELSFKQIRKIRIEDLLGRDPIRLDTDLIRQSYSDKVILITGGAGSIGSEIVRQLIPFAPKKILVLDQAESALYDLELEIRERLHWTRFETIIGDVCKPERMQRVFEHFRPQVVFHAAAYKHVPVMENNPSESIHTNVYGTRVIADLANRFGAEKFVMVSTDKAVNPTSIMGASKRIAEMYCQSLQQVSSTKFVTTRFGNVLDSNGSVIPRFRKQIDEGGPITVTHPDITRFFMTIPEACQLVLEAGAIGKGGEIFIFDMGRSVRIADLARKMVKLSGLTEGKDIQIVYTGLRPGEKLYEELLHSQENTLPTHHPKILIARVAEYDHTVVAAHADALSELVRRQDNEALVAKMKAIVPEYRSHNSEYEKLDRPIHSPAP
jgi:FlaA1/EpsC-like NDP-sugar epimerase